MRCRQATDGPLAQYLADVNRTPLLTPAEERILARQIKNGLTADARAAARDHLIRANLRLVIKIARGFVHHGLDLEDLIGHGNAGLCMAVDHFDLGFSTKFSTYASFWIKERIKLALRTENGGHFRVPSYLVLLLNKWHRAERALTNQLRRPPLFDEVAAVVPMTPGQRVHIRIALESNAMVRQEESTASDMRLADVLSDHADGPGQSVDQADEDTALMDRVRALAARRGVSGSAAFAMLLGHCGFDGERKTLESLSQEYGLTKERVRQLESQAIRAIRWELAGCGIG